MDPAPDKVLELAVRESVGSRRTEERANMSDLVTQLRNAALNGSCCIVEIARMTIFWVAADEIERLRAREDAHHLEIAKMLGELAALRPPTESEQT